MHYFTVAAADKTHTPVELTPSNVNFDKEIGEGGYGTVYRVTFKKPVKGYTTAAAKSVTKFRKEEIDILKKADHCNIVKLIGSYFQVPNINILFFELATLGSLQDYLSDVSKPLSLKLVKKWLTESALALQYLHDNKLIHRDIKPSNCLLFDDLVLKLSDFGLARELDDSHTYSSQKGTHRYMAPEIHKSNRFSRFTDIYAYGMLALHTYSRKEPFEGMEWQCVVFRVPSEQLKPKIPQGCPRDLIELITRCIATNPSDRPDAASILAMGKNIAQHFPYSSSSLSSSSFLLRLLLLTPPPPSPPTSPLHLLLPSTTITTTTSSSSTSTKS